MINSKKNRRGHLLYGFASVLVVLTSLCGILLSRSAEVYQSSADYERRVQSRLALESAVVYLSASPEIEEVSLQLPRAHVDISNVKTIGDTFQRTVTMTLLNSHGKVTAEREAEIVYTISDTNELLYGGSVWK